MGAVLMAVHGEQWCTIESDPGVFTELISEIGVQGVQVEELWSFDLETLEALKPIYGLVFLFKWRSEEDNRPVMTDYDMKEIFFANQVINNACATQAILSILLNAKDIQIGSKLEEFKEFVQTLPPDMKGLAIGNCEQIRLAHNGFARPEPLISDGVPATGGRDEEVYHFISYLPINGHMYELDGLKDGPIQLGECTSENWLQRIMPEIQKRIERYSQSEIRFNLMALIKSPTVRLEEERNALQTRKSALENKLNQGAEAMDVDVPDLPTTPEAQTAELARVTQELSDCEAKLRTETEKLKSWKVENIRRKHNYIPFIVNFLKYLAEQDQLLPLIENST